MSEFSDAARRIGLNNVTTMNLLRTFSPMVARQAEQMERTTLHGRALGLTDEETREVIDAWIAWYGIRPDEFPWEVVERSLTLRGVGEEWRPT
jgi:hypothetical protein